MELKSLLELQELLQVVHHVPGRIRIKFKADLMSYLRAKDALKRIKGLAGNDAKDHLIQLIGGNGILKFQRPLQGVESVRVNLGARSIIIRYDPEHFNPEWVYELLTTRSSERLLAMLAELRQRFDL